MALLTIKPPKELMDTIINLGNKIDDVAPKMLRAGAVPLQKELKKNATSHVKTGDMLKSLKVARAKKSKSGSWSILLEFAGNDTKGVSNSAKAFFLEYGTSKMEAKPFIRNSIKQSEEATSNAMQDVFDDFIESLK